MTIKRPDPVLSELDKKLLILLSEIIVNVGTKGEGGLNVWEGCAPLSQESARELETLLTHYVERRRVMKALAFAESVARADRGNEKRSRSIFLEMRTEAGRTRVVSTSQWTSFQLRLGIDWNIGRGTYAEVMPYSHFLRMEYQLLRLLGVHPSVVSLIVKMFEEEERKVEEIREGIRMLALGQVSGSINAVLRRVRAIAEGALSDTPLLRDHLVGTITTVADIAVFGVTRDWSVTGTLSMIGGAIATDAKSSNSKP